jgi:hypothetical protein
VHLAGVEEMKKEPVAWMNSKGDIILPANQANKDYNIPLYTAPRELSDKEIEEVFQEVIKQPYYLLLGDTQRFARAILKKASEK